MAGVVNFIFDAKTLCLTKINWIFKFADLYFSLHL